MASDDYDMMEADDEGEEWTILQSEHGETENTYKRLRLSQTESGGSRDNTSQQASQVVRRGVGDVRDFYIPEESRQQSRKLRRTAACWRCALQRDPCDENMPCTRCLDRLRKGQVYFFDCDRSRLPDFVVDFLPPSFTLPYQKQLIDDIVQNQVMEWDRSNPIDVSFTCGYGPSLRLELYEFRPRDVTLLQQIQYFRDPISGELERSLKYSLPLGMLELVPSDDHYFDSYVETLMKAEYLCQFAWICFREEVEIDPFAFQANLLNLIITLYLDTTDVDISRLLRSIIRMIIIIYIMGHTLTIAEESLPFVMDEVKYSHRPASLTPCTSSRLASRQLKFYFAVMLKSSFTGVLEYHQQLLRTSGRRDESFLPAMCVTLGLAIALEEIQRTLLIEADAKPALEILSIEEATGEADNACERIDTRFKLLVGLFQCKYRDKKWTEGTFGPYTPILQEKASRAFLQDLRALLEQSCEHLDTRQDVSLGPQNEYLCTSRLVARFLLPFLKLPT